ncbi:MAG: DUF1493 family protein [Bacteroidota bacterium]
MYAEKPDELRDFISDFCGIPKEAILEKSGLETDLNIYGDDAVELLIAYGKKFNVNVSQFKAAEYFSAEGGLNLLSRLFKISNVKPLQVSHLVKGIIAGKLDESVINRGFSRNVAKTQTYDPLNHNTRLYCFSLPFDNCMHPR